MFIDRIVQWFLPREAKFFVYIESMARNMKVSADAFAELCQAEGRQGFEEIAERLRALEHENDEIAHVIYEELDKTFVTPIDREDLHALTSSVDDVIDMIESCSSRILVYHLRELTDPMREMIGLLRDAAHEIAACLIALHDLGKLEQIQVHVIRVNSLENEADVVYRRALSKLFEAPTDAVELVREKEILDQLEKAVDACEDVMDLIRSVVVKNA